MWAKTLGLTKKFHIWPALDELYCLYLKSTGGDTVRVRPPLAPYTGLQT